MSPESSKNTNWYLKLEAWCCTHRILATTPVIILLLAFSQPTSITLYAGSVIVLLGEMGRTWASGYIEKNTRLATAGPYRFTRNPLYFFNGIIFIGFCTMAANPWAALFGMIAFTVIYKPTLRDEENHMRKLFGDEFNHWASVVPLFWPKWTSYPTQGNYSWILVIQHREHKNALAMLAGIALFVGIYWLKQAI
ncbi:MAG: isoprenylcysteine carboxylmethyltransferase family protein [Mariprofundaceae bacterium]